MDRQRHQRDFLTVERSSGTTGVWTVVASGLLATATSWVDSNVTAGASYNYQVVASPARWRRPTQHSVGHGACRRPGGPD